MFRWRSPVRLGCVLTPPLAVSAGFLVTPVSAGFLVTPPDAGRLCLGGVCGAGCRLSGLRRTRVFGNGGGCFGGIPGALWALNLVTLLLATPPVGINHLPLTVRDEGEQIAIWCVEPECRIPQQLACCPAHLLSDLQFCHVNCTGVDVLTPPLLTPPLLTPPLLTPQPNGAVKAKSQLALTREAQPAGQGSRRAAQGTRRAMRLYAISGGV